MNENMRAAIVSRLLAQLDYLSEVIRYEDSTETVYTQYSIDWIEYLLEEMNEGREPEAITRMATEIAREKANPTLRAPQSMGSTGYSRGVSEEGQDEIPF